MLNSIQAGAVIDGYRVIGVLGRGGMGKVYRVEHLLTGRQEAMKILEGSRVNAGDHYERFIREIQLQASLNHANIAAVHHAFWMDDDLVMIMELVEGTTLRSRLDMGRLPLQCALDYARQVLSALQHAHDHGIVHRDVTPANILITPLGTVKLTDFGLAKTPSDIRFTQSGAVMGSLHYMSPEQVRGVASLDARTDIYSMGVVLYEMATGKRPFEAGDPFSLMLAQVQQEPPEPIRMDSRIPAGLSSILLTALAKDPGRRFASANAFREALDFAIETPPAGRVLRWSQASLAMCVALGAAGAVSLSLAPKRETLPLSSMERRIAANLPKPPPEAWPIPAPAIPPATLPVEPVTDVPAKASRRASLKIATRVPRPESVRSSIVASANPAAGSLEPSKSPVHPAETAQSGTVESPKPPAALAKSSEAEAAPSAPRPAEPNNAQNDPPSNRRSWLRKALGKVAHPRGLHSAESNR